MVQTKSGAEVPSTPPRVDDPDQIPDQIVVKTQGPPQETCEYTYILGALAKIHSGTQEGSKQTRGDSTYTKGH